MPLELGASRAAGSIELKVVQRSLNAMHIHVLGVGSIGSLLALHLRHSTPHNITLLVKRESFAQTLRRELEQVITVERDGSLIRASGFNVQLTDPAAETMRNLLRSPSGETRAKLLRPRSNSLPTLPAHQDSKEPITSLIVTTKAPSTLRALRALSSRLTPESTITLLQNGMGVYEELCAKLFQSPSQRPHFVLASTTHGAWSKRPFFVVHAGMGDLVFGVAPSSRVNLPTDFGREDYKNMARSQSREGLDKSESDLEKNQEYMLTQLAPHNSLYNTIRALLSLRGLHTSWISASDLQERLQRKLVTNSVINPLTAILGCRNGALVGNRYAHRIGRDVCSEAESVFRAQILEDDGHPSSATEGESMYSETDLANANIPQRLTAASLEQEFARVARLTAVNFSSMLSDVRKGTETEVDFMNGYLARMGVKYGIPTPVNDMLRRLVKMKAQMPDGEK